MSNASTRAARTCRALKRTGRAAFTFAELLVAGVILSVLLTVIARAVIWSAAARRTTAREQLALQEASNILERLTSESQNQLTPQRVGAVGLPEDARNELPESEVAVSLTPADGKPPAQALDGLHTLARAFRRAETTGPA